MTEQLLELRENDMMDTAGKGCTYCRRQVEARPCPVDGREFIPALCDECFSAIRRAGCHDVQRDREVFYP